MVAPYLSLAVQRQTLQMTSATSAVAAAGCRTALVGSAAEHPAACGKEDEVS